MMMMMINQFIFSEDVTNLYLPQKMQGINIMGNIAPWDDSYLNDCSGPPNVYHQTLPTKPLFSTDCTPASYDQTWITIYLRIGCFL